nr:odorant-binding protein 11 [Lytta caraganae]
MFAKITPFFLLTIIHKINAMNVEQLAKINDYNQFCMVESHVNPEQIEAVKRNNFNDDDVKLRQHGYCFAKKLNFIDGRGNLQIDLIRSKLYEQLSSSKTEADELIAKCATIKATPEETAYHLLKCLHINVPRGTVYVR